MKCLYETYLKCHFRYGDLYCSKGSLRIINDRLHHILIYLICQLNLRLILHRAVSNHSAPIGARIPLSCLQIDTIVSVTAHDPDPNSSLFMHQMDTIRDGQNTHQHRQLDGSLTLLFIYTPRQVCANKTKKIANTRTFVALFWMADG